MKIGWVKRLAAVELKGSPGYSEAPATAFD